MSELVIAAASDDMTYTCKVEYSTNSFTKEATVDVYREFRIPFQFCVKVLESCRVPPNIFPSELATSQVTKEVLTGKAATFTCTVSESRTKPQEMSWTVDGKAVVVG